MPEITAVRVRVTGRVQGVNFRGWTQRQAERLGLTGWVQNEPDGSVTALLVGPEAAVRRMTEAMWDGPPAAAVSKVMAERAETGAIPVGFRVRG